MKQNLIFVITIILITCCNVSVAQHNLNVFSKVDGIKDVRSCYSGLFENHNTWVDYLENKNPQFEREKFEKIHTKALYDKDKELLQCYFFTYIVDDLEIGGYLIKPQQNNNSPVIIMNRGGTGLYGNMTFPSLHTNAFYLVRAGYVVIGSQYRGGEGKPVAIGGLDEYGGEDVKDVMALFAIIDTLEGVDKNRIGMFSASRGSINMFQVAKETQRIKAIVSISGVYDLKHELVELPHVKRIYQNHIPRFSNEKEQELTKRSVINWANKLDFNAPILIMHGGYDNRASASGALKFAQRLQSLEMRYSIVIYAGEDHYFSKHWNELKKETIDWFNKFI